jgi:hypothetical protein
MAFGPQTSILTKAERINVVAWEAEIDKFLIDKFLKEDPIAQRDQGDIIFQLFLYSDMIFADSLPLPTQRVINILKSRYLAAGWEKVEWGDKCMIFSHTKTSER